VRIAGAELTALGDREPTQLRRDRIGFIFQTFNLLPVLNAEENILLPLSIAGRKPDREWFDRLVDTVGIRDWLSHRPAEMSGGQQQRVAVARALISRPSVVFARRRGRLRLLPAGRVELAGSAGSEQVVRERVPAGTLSHRRAVQAGPGRPDQQLAHADLRALALSVIVSLFGIVNTLILSIYERTRELGMMRAIGTSRPQVRQMIRYESLITALIGGVFGLVIGVVGTVLLSTFAFSGSEYVQAYPVGTLVILLVVAAAAGLLAAQLPARRAARLDMLKALASE
jgi:ABC transporter/FtsX-like permease family